MDGSQNIFDFEDDSLIDMNQLSESLVDVDPYSCELPGAVKDEKEADNDIEVDANNRMPKLHESVEPGPSKKGGKYNLRKSLAWDSAFFTSAGVLDQEELTNMMNGPDKAKRNVLPSIEEDVSGSTESISSLQSDNLTLDSLEDDLFVDIRASIQRSSKKKSNLRNTSGMTIAAEVDNQAISTINKEGLASQKKNLIPASKKANGLQALRTSKCQPSNIGKSVPGKTVKHGLIPSQVTKSTAKTGQSNPVLTRPPKVTSKPMIPTLTAPGKRDSTGTSHAKPYNGSSKLGVAMVSRREILPPKASSVSCAEKTSLRKPAISSKSSLRSSTTSSVQSIRSSTSSDSSSSISSKTISAKSPSVPARRNPVKSVNCGAAPSGSTQKTPSKAVPKNRLPSSKIPSKICSSVSPASSISDWSSVSSSSSLVNPRLNSSITILDDSSCTSLDYNLISSDPKNQLIDDANVDGNQRAPGNRSKKSSTQTGTVQTLAKPSGLRLPSPKIGFFDGVKSSARTPQKSQSGLCTMVLTGGASVSGPIRNSNIKLSSSNVQTGTPLPSTSPKYTSRTSLNKKLYAPRNNPAGDIAAGNYFQKIREVQFEDSVDQLGETAVGAFIKEKLDDLHKETDLSMHKNVDIVVMKNATAEGSNGSASKHAGQKGHKDIESSPNPICIGDTEEKSSLMVKPHEIDGNPTFSGPLNEALSEILNSAMASLSSVHTIPSVIKDVSDNNDCKSLSKEPATQVKSEDCPPSAAQRSQSGLYPKLHKSGAAVCILSRNSNIKPTATPLAKIKPASPKYSSPKSLQKESHASGNGSLNLALEVKDIATGHHCQNAGNVQTVGGYGQLDDSNEETDLSMNENVDSGVMSNSTTEGNNCLSPKHAGRRAYENHTNIPSPICAIDDQEDSPGINKRGVAKSHGGDVNPTVTGPMEEVLSEILESATASMSALNIAPSALNKIMDNGDCISLSKDAVIQMKPSVMLPQNGPLCTPSQESNMKLKSSDFQTATVIMPGSPEYTRTSENDIPKLGLQFQHNPTGNDCQIVGNGQVDELNQERDPRMQKDVDIGVIKNDDQTVGEDDKASTNLISSITDDKENPSGLCGGMVKDILESLTASMFSLHVTSPFPHKNIDDCTSLTDVIQVKSMNGADGKSNSKSMVPTAATPLAKIKPGHLCQQVLFVNDNSKEETFLSMYTDVDEKENGSTYAQQIEEEEIQSEILYSESSPFRPPFALKNDDFLSKEC